MIKIFKSLLIILFFNTITLQAYSETSWITKKSDKSKEEIKIEKKIKKAEEKKKRKRINKKIKKNKKEFKEEDKKITKEVKSWITKKDYTYKYIENVDNLPTANIYFVAQSEDKKRIYGYINADLSSKKNGNYYITSVGIGFLDDGKTICQIASTIKDVDDGEVLGKVAGNCSDGTKFRGSFSQSGNDGYGRAKSNKGEIFNFDFNSELNIVSKKFKEFDEGVSGSMQASVPKHIVEPTGKYYALIIANSKYDKKEFWSDLKSPYNDAKEIKKIFDNKYKFTKTWLIEDASRGQIYDEFEKLKSTITDKDYLLIYYSGHGQTDINNVAYWIPKEGSDKYYSWVNVNSLTNTLEDIKARHILFMIDSCYSGLTFKSQNITNEDLVNDANVIKESLLFYSRKVLTSGTGKKRVLDTIPGENHSLFAKGFIKELNENKGNLRAEQIWQKLKYYHKGKKINQVPAYGTIDALSLADSNGDFVFHVPKNKQ